MLLTDAGTPVAELRTGPTEQFRGGRQTAHPTSRERAEIRAILAQPDAEILKLLVAVPFHPDHIVGATVTDLCTGGTGIETVLHVCIRYLIVVMHNAPLR
jgi:hypothetical protein